MESALADVVVLDLSHVFAGPYCAMMLGDLGANVIKIEQPDIGDDTRYFGPPYAGGESAYYLGLNRNKRSVALNFGTPEGKERLLEFVKTATVLIENYRPGSLEHKGLGYEDLRKINPGLIYCSITGYGPGGPYSHYPGYDLAAQAESGLMSITGDINGAPMPLGVPVADFTAGMFACSSILTALRVRDRTGEGQRIDISLLEAAVSLLSNVGSDYLVSGEEARRYGYGHPNVVPYQEFPTRDGYVVVACGNDKLYRSFCHVVGRDELATDPRFTTNPLRAKNRAELLPILYQLLLEQPTAYWVKQLRDAGVPCGPIDTVSQALNHPQIQAREFIWECDHPTIGKLRLIGSPMRLSKTPPRLYKAPPLLGEDSNLLE